MIARTGKARLTGIVGSFNRAAFDGCQAWRPGKSTRGAMSARVIRRSLPCPVWSEHRSAADSIGRRKFAALVLTNRSADGRHGTTDHAARCNYLHVYKNVAALFCMPLRVARGTTSHDPVAYVRAPTRCRATELTTGRHRVRVA
jgi:hypothetical protein